MTERASYPCDTVVKPRWSILQNTRYLHGRSFNKNHLHRWMIPANLMIRLVLQSCVM